eukprot:SM000368S13749  [mRNA]  locus=s368:44003:44489:+ [translate_table: standard]
MTASTACLPQRKRTAAAAPAPEKSVSGAACASCGSWCLALHTFAASVRCSSTLSHTCRRWRLARSPCAASASTIATATALKLRGYQGPHPYGHPAMAAATAAAMAVAAGAVEIGGLTPPLLMGLCRR